jgi:hypothetical protein
LYIQPEDAPPARRGRRPWKPAYNAARTTQSVLLSLTPEDAAALKAAAKANARTVSAHVARLVSATDGAPCTHREADPLLDASRLAAAIAQVPREVRSLQGDLLRLGGLVKSLFVRPESVGLAEQHATECSRALALLTTSAAATVPIVARIEDELASLRAQAEHAVLRIDSADRA